MTSLASGSSGNAFLVQTDALTLLVEAGLSARALERHLKHRAIDPGSLHAIIVSHEHHDHIQGAGPLSRRYGIPIICSAGTADAMREAWKGLELRTLGATGTVLGDTEVSGFALPHDAAEPIAILLKTSDASAGWALDLGHVPPGLSQHLAPADLLVVEANHDLTRLQGSAYPIGTQLRIMGPTGHLSNLQAAELLVDIGADGRPRVAWLAHLSERTNERPRRVLNMIRTVLDMHGTSQIQLQIAERDHPSVTWSSWSFQMQQGYLDL